MERRINSTVRQYFNLRPTSTTSQQVKQSTTPTTSATWKTAAPQKNAPSSSSPTPATRDGAPLIDDEDFSKMHRLTGIDALEVGYFWLVLKRHLDYDVTFASPRGGAVALDPMSLELANKDEKLKDKLRNDREFMERVSHTMPIRWINPKDYQVVLVPGRHGALFDLPECRDVASCISEIWSNDGWVCAIGHGVAALLNVKTDKGEYFVKNKTITCYSNAEEREKRFDDYLPYLLEDKLKERGAKIDNAGPFKPHVVEDEKDRIITGQSFPSIKQFVAKIAEKTAGKKPFDVEQVQWK